MQGFHNISGNAYIVVCTGFSVSLGWLKFLLLCHLYFVASVHSTSFWFIHVGVAGNYSFDDWITGMDSS